MAPPTRTFAHDTKKLKGWTDAAWYYADGAAAMKVSSEEIATHLNTTARTVTRQLAEGVPSARKLPGRKPHQEQERRRAALRAIATKRYITVGKKVGPRKTVYRRVTHTSCPSVRRQGRELAAKGFKCTSRETVREDLKALGFKAFKRPFAPFLSAFDRERRVAFAKRELLKLPEALKRVLFSDESSFDCGDHTSPFQWAFNRDDVLPRGTSASGARVMVYGVVGVGVKKLVILPETTKDEDGVTRGVTADRHIRLCLSPSIGLLTAPGAVYQYDGARIHTCKRTQAYLQRKGVQRIEDWPAYSPDLSPIEGLWAILKERVSRHGPLGRPQLVAFIQKEWDLLPQAMVDRVVLSYQRRLVECVAKKGKTIRG